LWRERWGDNDICPLQLDTVITKNLEKMKWVLPVYAAGTLVYSASLTFRRLGSCLSSSCDVFT
jgi:hypothetical protein